MPESDRALSLDFVNLMEDRGEISEDSINDLLAALLSLDLKGVKKKVEDLYTCFEIRALSQYVGNRESIQINIYTLKIGDNAP